MQSENIANIYQLVTDDRNASLSVPYS